MNESASALTVRSMREDDLPQVLLIERVSFPSPWSSIAFQSELSNRSRARCIVLDDAEGELAGYAIMHCVLDEVHLVNIATHPDKRGQGNGDKLLRAVLHLGREWGGAYFTLEVREHNNVAQRLYEKYEFHKVAIRKGYYSDTGEDAVVMVLTGAPYPPVNDLHFQSELMTSTE